jgi:CBS domain-containing protein
MKLGELLNTKDLKHRVAVSVDPDDTISATIQKMVEHDRGSLPVCNDSGELVGIITERDIVRKCFSGGTDCSKYRIKDVMSRKVVVGKTDDDLDYAINVMNKAPPGGRREKGNRHDFHARPAGHTAGTVPDEGSLSQRLYLRGIFAGQLLGKNHSGLFPARFLTELV